jgi:hypothetical protein
MPQFFTTNVLQLCVRHPVGFWGLMFSFYVINVIAQFSVHLGGLY